MNTFSQNLKNLFAYSFVQSSSQDFESPQPNPSAEPTTEATPTGSFAKAPHKQPLQAKLAISIYEMQTISNALIAYAKLLANKEEKARARDVRNLEKKVFEQLLAIDVEAQAA
ncbi:MAG TPA: hypothetical protein DCM08_13735 [Microscillaceae bacterium]|jgi:hypothetical protein|nr:hypothetical protein [Microscillaceae bacterium]